MEQDDSSGAVLGDVGMEQQRKRTRGQGQQYSDCRRGGWVEVKEGIRG